MLNHFVSPGTLILGKGGTETMVEHGFLLSLRRREQVFEHRRAEALTSRMAFAIRIPPLHAALRNTHEFTYAACQTPISGAH